MKKILLFFLLLCCFIFSGAIAQKERNIWYFGEYAGLDFNSGVPVALTNGRLSSSEGCATVSDSNGKLLFYTNGVSVWDANHNVMPHGTGLHGKQSTTQSALIVPKPGSTTIYYLFTAPAIEYPDSSGLEYSVVDMTLNGGLGDIVSSSKNIFLYKPITEKLAGVTDCSGISWVVVHENGNNTFLSFKIDNSGVSSIPVKSNVGSIHPGDYFQDQNSARGYLKISPNGKKLAVAITGQSLVELFDFCSINGVVSNAISIPTEHPYGISFSPDNSRLYVSKGTEPGLLQYNVLAGAGNADSIRASETFIGSLNPIRTALQIASDEKIYVGLNGGDYIGVINNPNGLGETCDYVDDAINLKSGRSILGLPNFIEKACGDCNLPCDLLTLSARGYYDPPTGDCCSEFTLHNLFTSGVVYSISATLLTPGITVRSASGPWNPQPTWSSSKITWSISSPGLLKGTRDSLFACFNNPADTSLRLKIDWQDANGTTLCTDTIVFACKTISVSGEKNYGAEISLSSPYPDPSSSNTSLSFVLNRSDVVSIVVRDVLGQEVLRVIDHQLFDKGQHSVDIDLSSLPSGLYFYSLRTPAGIQTRTLRVVR